MRLIEKIILLLLVFSLLPMIVVGGVFYYSVKSTVEKQTIDQLSSVATIQEHRIVDIRSQNLKRIADFTSRTQLRALVNAYNDAPSKAIQDKIMPILNDAQRLGKDIHSITVLDTQGKVVTSTEKNPSTLQTLARDMHKLGMEKDSIRLANNNSDQNTAFYISGPFLENGKKIGFIGVEVAASNVLKTITDPTGLGETGEIYMGHKLDDGQLSFIKPNRFDNPIADQTISNSELPMFKTLMGEEAIFPDIVDYRGEHVFAVTRSIEDSGWGLVAKIDRVEALQPLVGLRSELLLLAFINSVLVVFTAIALARRFTQPIIEIDEIAEQTSKGNLKGRVVKPSNDEIGNLAGTFNTMLDNLELFDKAKSDFVSLASHQLRTPLTSIKWSTEELTNPKAPPDEAKQKKYLKQIHASNERMIELVGALLRVSKIDVGTLEPKDEAVSLEKALKQVLTDLKVLIDTKGITIKQDVDKGLPKIEMDPNWTRVIFQNLISNAIRYSPSKKTVDISIKQHSGHLLFKVKDRGYGIPDSQKDKIFAKFFRAENAQKLTSDGSGLGLYITKSMVERAGGTIWFESTEGKGSTFYVKLPINE